MNTKDIKVTINRMGTFKLRHKSQHTDTQCGVSGREEYRYKVSVTGSSEHLDDKGFLIDNLVVKSYFEDTYEKKLKEANSCELMACACVDFIKQYCKKNDISHIERIYVEIHGSEVSFISAEWNKE